MSDMFSDEDQDQPQQAAPQPTQTDTDVNYWKAEAQKAFSARDEARTELRTHIQSGYDPAVVELVPQNLAPTEWKAYADKLVAFRGEAPPVTPETSSEEPSPEVDVPAETLAGIVNGPSGGTAGNAGISHSEWLQLVGSNPPEAQRLYAAGKVDFSQMRQGLGPDQ